MVATCYLQGRDARAVDHDGTCANQRTDAYLGVFLAGKVGLMFHTYLNYDYDIYLFMYLLPMMEVEHTPCSKGNDFSTRVMFSLPSHNGFHGFSCFPFVFLDS